MSDNELPNLGNNETEVPKTREVHLNQPFQLFGENSYIRNRYVPKYTSNIILDTDNILPSIPFEIQAFASNTRKIASVTPLDPQIGYTITKEDFNVESRRKKVLASFNELDQYVDNTSQRLCVQLSSYTNELKRVGIILPSESPYLSTCCKS